MSKYEHLGQAGLTLVFLVTLSWTPFLLNVPLLAYHVNKFVLRGGALLAGGSAQPG